MKTGMLILLLIRSHALADETLLQRIMTAADRDSDGKLTLEEYKPLDVQARHHGEEHFKAADADQNGTLDAAELAKSLQKQTWFAILSEGAASCFKRLDANHDAKLDGSEYRQISRMGGHAAQHFSGADQSGDGFLDLAEFEAHANELLQRLKRTSKR